jgi:hypothetical protein
MKTIPLNNAISIRRDSAPLAEVLLYHNSDVVERIAKEYSIPLAEAESVFGDTIRFLYLAGATDAKQLAPTKNIDRGWHCFLMFTRDYAEFCNAYFSRFIHHEPRRRGIAPPTFDHRTATFDAARQVFGPDLSANWDGDIRSADCETFKCTSECSPDTGGGGNECTPDSGD